MGIRIHKAIGWGLTNVKVHDPRFNKEPLDGWYGAFQDAIIPFIKWTVDHRDEALSIVKDANGYDTGILSFGLLELGKEWKATGTIKNPPGHFYNYDDEFGIRNVMLFVPLEKPDWYRWDDNIDYYEAGRVAKNTVKKLTNSCGIYPWLSMVKIPGAPTPPEIPDDIKCLLKQLEPFVMPSTYNQLVGRWDKKAKPIAQGDVLDYMLKWYRPGIADSVILFTKYINIFKNWEKIIHELRPMIYTWWS